MNKLAKQPQTVLEEWRDVVGLEGYYQVSNIGRVRSFRIKGTRRNRTSARPTMMKLQSRKGYLLAVLTTKSGSKKTPVNRLVLEAFVGPCPDRMETRHLNGHKQDNRVKNLTWGTKSQNELDKVRHGTSLRGKGAGKRKAILTEDAVREIRSLDGVVSLEELAERFGCSTWAINSVICRDSWTHVEG